MPDRWIPSDLSAELAWWELRALAACCPGGTLALVEHLARGCRPPKRHRPRCGARTRAGHPCRAPALWRRGEPRPANGRCRMHGGLSTGARTEAGKERAREGTRRFWASRRGAPRVELEHLPDLPSLRRLVALRREGLSLRALAARLNAEGWSAPDGKPWASWRVRLVLRAWGEP